MDAARPIKKILKSKPTLEGAGVHLNRVFGHPHIPQLDPFLLLDDFHSQNPDEYIRGFPWHPHRGIETITYVLQGKVAHGDSMGNKGMIGPGDVQWMTAGSGIIHQEMPEGDTSDRLWGFQLWANLPASHKMIYPRYQEITSQQIPEVTLDKNITVKVICGEIDKVKGPVKDIVTDPVYLDVSMPPKTQFIHQVRSGHTVFAYVFDGKGCFEPARDPFHYDKEGRNYFDLERECLIGPESLIIYERDGEKLDISTEEQSVRFLLVSGKPIQEPIAWHGPIVMNTQEELRVAFDEYQNGTFLKHQSNR